MISSPYCAVFADRNWQLERWRPLAMVRSVPHIHSGLGILGFHARRQFIVRSQLPKISRDVGNHRHLFVFFPPLAAQHQGTAADGYLHIFGIDPSEGCSTDQRVIFPEAFDCWLG
jgi:hypothetical protein